MTEEKDPEPEMEPVDENSEMENSRDLKGASVEDELISIIEIGPTMISEAGDTKSPAQRAIQFFTDEDSDEALEREIVKGARVRVMEGIMKRAGDKSFQPRGRRITSAREREV